MKKTIPFMVLMLLAFLVIAPRAASTESEYTDADRVTVSVSQADLVLSYDWYGCYQGNAIVPCE